jgi:amidase
MLGRGVESQGENALGSNAFGKVSRRTVLRLTALAAAAAPTLNQLVSAPAVRAQETTTTAESAADVGDLVDVSIGELRGSMEAHRTTSREITNGYIERIERLDPRLHSVIEVNPDALAIAEALDDERQRGKVRGPLHGVPILLKDNIDTADKTHTGAGSLALVGTQPSKDATVARLLREAGAVLLGKANLSEWANFRSTHSSSGWSGRGAQCGNPYILDRNPCGSSSGSGAATAASFAAGALATETDGSIVCPASHCAVVGIKPTVGLTSRAGVVPISHNQDTIGSHGRTVADAAAILTAITGVVDARDPATSINTGPRLDYTKFLDAAALKGARIGVARDQGFGISPKTDAVMETAIQAIKNAGATVIDNLSISKFENSTTGASELTVLLFDFKQDVAAYMATRSGGPKTLQDLIDFNNSHAARELKFFGQELFIQAEATDGFGDPKYIAALHDSHDVSKAALDQVFANNGTPLDAIVAPTNSPAWVTDLVNGDHFLLASTGPAARAGYPLVTVPAGLPFGLPVGITFMGRPLGEANLVRLAFSFEQATKIRRPPKFLPTLPT